MSSANGVVVRSAPAPSVELSVAAVAVGAAPRKTFTQPSRWTAHRHRLAAVLVDGERHTGSELFLAAAADCDPRRSARCVPDADAERRALSGPDRARLGRWSLIYQTLVKMECRHTGRGLAGVFWLEGAALALLRRALPLPAGATPGEPAVAFPPPLAEDARRAVAPRLPAAYPFACPVCLGRSVLHAGFYPDEAPERAWTACRACGGMGVVWGTGPTGPPQEEECAISLPERRALP